jgi:hypothetical protein
MQSIDSRAAGRIKAFGETLTEPIDIRFSPAQDSRNDQMRTFCEQLTQITDRIRLKIDHDENGHLPSILIGSNIRYQAVPLGRELEPFLDALRMLQTPVSEDVVARVEMVDLPVGLKIYVAQQCGFCPMVLKQLLPLPFGNANIRLTIIDAFLFEELARDHSIKAVPTIILDDQLRWTGNDIPLSELIEAMTDRDPASLPVSVLERMITDGAAFSLAAMMMKANAIFPSFIEVLLNEQFTIRLGAMSIMEEIAESAPSVGKQIIQPLTERFDTLSDTVKGDMLYVMGELQSEDALPLIRSVIRGDYDPEVIEAAREALEKFPNPA